jgi:hypothetical protein
MTNIDDILGNQSLKVERIKIDIDGMCECFWPFEYGEYDAKNKKLTMYCSNPELSHAITIDWVMEDRGQTQ